MSYKSTIKLIIFRKDTRFKGNNVTLENTKKHQIWVKARRTVPRCSDAVGYLEHDSNFVIYTKVVTLSIINNHGMLIVQFLINFLCSYCLKFPPICPCGKNNQGKNCKLDVFFTSDLNRMAIYVNMQLNYIKMQDMRQSLFEFLTFK